MEAAREAVGRLAAEDPHDRLCEGCDLVLPCLWNSTPAAEAATAVETLCGLCDGASAREAWLVLLERASAPLRGGETGRGVAGVLLPVLLHVLRRAVACGDRVRGIVKSAVRDVPPLLLKWTQHDAVLPLKPIDVAPGSEPVEAGGAADAEGDAVKTDPAMAAGFAGVYPHLKEMARVVAAAHTAAVAAHPESRAARREAHGPANLILSIMAAACASQGCGGDDDAPAPAGPGGAFAPGPKAGVDPELAACLASLAPFGDYNYTLMHAARRTHFEKLSGTAVGEEGAAGGFLDLHAQGLGLYLFGRGGAGPAPAFLHAWHVFAHSAPYLTSLLQSPSTSMVWEGLEGVKAAVYRFPSFTLDLEAIRGADAAPPPPGAAEGVREKDLEVAGEARGSDAMALWFEVMQAVSHVMVGCPLHEVRLAGVHVLQTMFTRLAEKARFRVFTSFIRTCPHESVSALVVNGFKNEVRDEYEALVAAGTDEERDVLRRESAFLQHDVFEFATGLVSELAAHHPHRAETLASLLALIQFILLRERVAQALRLPATVLDRVTAASDAVDAALPAINAAAPDAAVQTGMMLAFSAGCVRDAAAALRAL